MSNKEFIGLLLGGILIFVGVCAAIFELSA
jgi:hypothetical protein